MIRERQQTRTFWVTGQKGLTEGEAAKAIVAEARELISKELGIPDAVWNVAAAAAAAARYAQYQSLLTSIFKYLIWLITQL